MDISSQRIERIETAIELQVDESDFRFESLAERELWHQIAAEAEARVDKDDRVWLAA